MGVVYRATQLGTDGEEVRDVAFKMIKTELADKLPAEAAQRFSREIHTAAQLRCPSCVMVFDFGRTESGSLFYAMEFVQGRRSRRFCASTGRCRLPRHWRSRGRCARRCR